MEKCSDVSCLTISGLDVILKQIIHRTASYTDLAALSSTAENVADFVSRLDVSNKRKKMILKVLGENGVRHQQRKLTG